MASHPHSASTPATRYRRSRRSEFAIWWREIDRVLLVVVLALMAVGTVAVAAASPPRLGGFPRRANGWTTCTFSGCTCAGSSLA